MALTRVVWRGVQHFIKEDTHTTLCRKDAQEMRVIRDEPTLLPMCETCEGHAIEYQHREERRKKPR
jgi:hypothetical protein